MQVQSDHGHGSPNAGGQNSEEAIWLDLVSRLQEPDDSFLDEQENSGQTGRADTATGASIPPGSATPTGSAPPTGTSSGKGVDDFDPLGVWRRQSTPPPTGPRPDVRSDTGGPAPAGPRDYEESELEEEFVPAPLPSLAGADPAIMLSWIGAAGGPIFLVVAAIFWRGIPLLGVIAVILAFLVGTGYLIYRLPKNRDHDDGDGAVV